MHIQYNSAHYVFSRVAIVVVFICEDYHDDQII